MDDVITSLFDDQPLKTINGVEFTAREIDVISCVLNNRGTKKIAQILSMSSRTVEAHVRNIMLKVGTNSREGIIDFVERSKEYGLAKQHYLAFLIEAKFKHVLNQVGSSSGKKIFCKFNLTYVDPKRIGNIKKLQEYMKLSHIEVIQRPEDAKDVGENVYVIYLLSSKDLGLLNSELEYTENWARSSLFLILDDEETSLAMKGANVLYLSHCKSYHDLVFAVLKILNPEFAWEELISSFQADCQALTRNSDFNVNDHVDNWSGQFNWKTFAGVMAGIAGFVMLLSVIMFQPNSLRTLKLSNNMYSHTKTQKTEVSRWNLPHFVDQYTERQHLTDALWSKFDEHSQTKAAILVGLYGLGGVGKTTLATHAIYHPRQTYQFIGWFRAENVNLLKSEYFALGERLQLFSPETSEMVKISLIKEWLEHQKNILLVYDNVSDMQILKDFLPNTGHIILTSRNYKVPGALEVEAMQELEALQLLQSLLPQTLQWSAYDLEQAKKLLHVLGYLPLAIVQAGVYMNENHLTIDAYLNLYKTHRNQLLSEKSLPAREHRDPVYISWNISAKAVQKLPVGGETLRLLDIVSYCYPEKIPKKLLMQYLYGSVTREAEISLNKHLHRLKQYSLIKTASEYISIHRLVHQWIQDKHGRGEKRKILDQAASAIIALHSWSQKTPDAVLFAKFLIPHVESILCHLQKVAADDQLLDLVATLGRFSEVVGDFRKSHKYFSRAVAICQNHLGESDIKTAQIKAELGWAHQNLGNYVKAAKNLRESLERFKQDFGLDHLETTDVMRKLGWTYSCLGKFSKAKALLEKALINSEKSFGENLAYTGDIQRELGWVYIHLGDYPKASNMLQMSLISKQKLQGADHVKTACVMGDLGWLDLTLGDYAAAKQKFKQAQVIMKRNFGPTHFKTAYLLNGLGLVSMEMGEFDKSQRQFQKALASVSKHYGSDHVETSVVLSNLGRIYLHLGQYAKAKEILEKALTIREKSYGVKNKRVAHLLKNLGHLYNQTGDAAMAINFSKRSLAIIKSYYDKDHIEMAPVLYNLACSYLHTSHYDEATQLFERAQSMNERHYGSHHMKVVSVLNGLGVSHCFLHRYAKSKALFEKALTVTHQLHGEDHIFPKMLLANLGNMHRICGDIHEAQKMLESSLETLSQFYGPDHIHVGVILGNLGLLFGALGDRKKKQAYLHKALAIFTAHCDSKHPFIQQTHYELQRDHKKPISNIKFQSGYFLVF